ncbi:MAG TPA: hypothetical protein VMX97_06940 [Hyphomicrobiaceae bacterium]|nr:hypothetical protein [Hyphomicrobiaceae bacterium]
MKKKKPAQDRAQRDIDREEFMSQLVKHGVFCLPPGGVTHDLGVAAFASATPNAVRRQMFRRPDGQSVESRTAVGRDWSTTEQIHTWILAGAEPHATNQNLTRAPKLCEDLLPDAA